MKIDAKNLNNMLAKPFQQCIKDTYCDIVIMRGLKILEYQLL